MGPGALIVIVHCAVVIVHQATKLIKLYCDHVIICAFSVQIIIFLCPLPLHMSFFLSLGTFQFHAPILIPFYFHPTGSPYHFAAREPRYGS